MWIILQINCTCFSRICKLLLWQIGINFLLREKNHDYLQKKVSPKWYFLVKCQHEFAQYVLARLKIADVCRIKWACVRNVHDHLALGY